MSKAEPMESEQSIEVQQLVNDIVAAMDGHDLSIVGCALGEVTAFWLASHVILEQAQLWRHQIDYVERITALFNRVPRPS